MADEDLEDSKINDDGQMDEDRLNEEDYQEPDFRGENIGEELTDAELECLKKELQSEISELEWEFKQAKESLYNERIMQVENKLNQAKMGTAPEFLHVVSLVEETYKIRLQVAKHRMEFALEITNKELDNELQIIQCDVNERLLEAEEQIRLSLQESLCKLQYERTTHERKFSEGKEYSKSSDQYDDYLPSPNLERRKKPVTLSPFSPRLIYQIPEKEIRSDVELILAAVKKHKLAFAVSQLKSRKIK
uniref:Breast cancer metastasis-suppressor 1 homolog n=1 Tax=Schistosoma japonicum TaxID=6182 RepID=Q5DFA6_SCHJA|nr:SJCHGC01139 protein [Schistosoma japonicum]CAX74157.1 Breast cancer metastasis-suppressor 1 homolog [Schistosoma japonicum]CAX74158.1 Breast cancer metastasis-suppressor 1 homolog [Schistosoma japonicum]